MKKELKIPGWVIIELKEKKKEYSRTRLGF